MKSWSTSIAVIPGRWTSYRHPREVEKLQRQHLWKMYMQYLEQQDNDQSGNEEEEEEEQQEETTDQEIMEDEDHVEDADP